MERFVWKRHKDIFKGVGIYHITFVVTGRQPLLGELAIDHDEPRCLPSDLGRAISHDLDEIQQRRPYVRLLAKQLMPDHIHVLLYVTDDCSVSIKEIARGMRQGWRQIATTISIDPQMPSAEEYKQMPKGVAQMPKGGAQMPSAEEYKQMPKGVAQMPKGVAQMPDTGTHQPLFETPFFRTLAHKGQLDTMIQYIHDNPRRAMLKQQNPDLFTLRRDTRVGELCFTSLGNLFLLDYPEKQPIICSRALSEQQITAQQTDALYQAKNGCITVTAAISPGERQIARAVREAGAPLIILLKDGFPKAGDPHEKYYKPGGVYFEACAAGRLLLLEPTADTLTLPDIQRRTEQTLREKAEARHWNYQPIPVTSDRYRMMAANEIVKVLCPWLKE
ncbi:MAG: transposase [Bacteroidales bacterium]|nr:transposase [Bacteroidales bacterium]